MNNEQETYELIDRYLADQLSASERYSFEQQLSQDADLRDAVDMHKMLQVTAVSYEMDQLHSKVGTDLDKIYKAGTIKKWLLIGGAGLALIATTLLLIPTEKTKSDQKTVVDQESGSEGQDQKISIVEDDLGKGESNHSKTNINEGLVQTTIANEFLHEEVVIETDTLLSDEVNNKDIEEVIITDADNGEVIMEKAKVENSVTQTIQCPSNRVDLKFRMTSQSLDDVEGSIHVQEVLSEGFTEPIQFKLKDIEATYSSMKIFNGLEADDYTIGIVDANGCEALSPVISVTKSSCVKNYTETFSPQYDHEWRLQINEDLDATVVLKNKGGKVVLMKKVNGEREFIWDGQDSNGSVIDEPGYMWFFVTYSNGETCSGGFNLIR